MVFRENGSSPGVRCSVADGDGSLRKYRIKSTNLQTLPKDNVEQELDCASCADFSLAWARMRACHVEWPDHKTDFASDDKEEKRTARVMMKMVDEINHGYIAKLGMTSPIQVQCVTCHRGLQKPQTIQAVVGETMEKKDVRRPSRSTQTCARSTTARELTTSRRLPVDLLSESLAQKTKAKEAASLLWR